MKETKRIIKEKNIIDAAIVVFGEVGFKNAKMEDIAQLAGITKVTLYAYFQSKENLYMAVTFRALTELNLMYEQAVNENKSKNGLESTMTLFERFMGFFESNFLFSEVLLEYFSLIRSTSSGKNEAKLTEAIRESSYFQKLQGIHNLPFKLTAREIERGKKDGSIKNSRDPMLLTLYGWTCVLGYLKVLAASGGGMIPLFKFNIQELRKLHIHNARALFTVVVP